MWNAVMNLAVVWYSGCMSPNLVWSGGICLCFCPRFSSLINFSTLIKRIKCTYLMGKCTNSLSHTHRRRHSYCCCTKCQLSLLPSAIAPTSEHCVCMGITSASISTFPVSSQTFHRFSPSFSSSTKSEPFVDSLNCDRAAVRAH